MTLQVHSTFTWLPTQSLQPVLWPYMLTTMLTWHNLSPTQDNLFYITSDCPDLPVIWTVLSWRTVVYPEWLWHVCQPIPMLLEITNIKNLHFPRHAHEHNQPWNDGKMKKFHTAVDDASTCVACMLDTVTLMTGLTYTQRQTSIFSVCRDKMILHVWPPSMIFNFQENMVHRTCLTLCGAIIRQPPFFGWKIMKQFSSYDQENTVYLQTVLWTP